MANSKYEYVKSFEVEDEVFLPNLVVIRIDGRDFLRFSQVHNFEKPNDERAVNLMNSCAVAVSEEYPDIVFSYGYSDEYSAKFENRSLCTYEHLTICCASIEVLQAYLAWRQNDCLINNQYETCLGMLVKCGKTESEAREILKGTQKQEKNELPELFHQGSCVFKIEVEDIVNYNENGTPVKRLRRKARIVHSENIARKKFWNEHPKLMAVIFTVAVLQEFRDITFSYGVSDEYSFVLKKETLFYQRRASDIVSVIVSFFTSIQVDCHINNQYNTCFWMLFMSGKSKSEAQGYLKGTQTREKNELLIQKFGIDYNQLPIMFRQGSSVFRVEAEKTMAFENGSPAEKLRNKVMVSHCNIIEHSFCKEHPSILDEEPHIQ
ncbi:hypothetical protein LWI28_015542 [Acer negundo]|uniref:tRNA(His) guanylyltransferase n=1 Tax=Acer negundo TaxID=4023 RepID=A0AAD5IJG8_ACENE|nr:hypothetical protein LWI28_015542 [Acer negundo]